MDKTEHADAKHFKPAGKKTKDWYALWGNKCPVCLAPAVFE